MILPLLALLVQAAVPPQAPDIVVQPPAKPSAQTPATLVVEPVAMFIAACDADQDGVTTRIEMQECVARSFAAIDTAHAGKLRYFPFADWALRYLGDRNALPSPFDVDTDGDDMVSLDELQAQFSKLWSRFNRDRGDDGITRAELLTFRTGPVDRDGPTKPGLPKGGKPPAAPPAAPAGGRQDRRR